MHVWEDGHQYVVSFLEVSEFQRELVKKQMLTDQLLHTWRDAVIALKIGGWRLLIIFIIDFLIQFLVSRSTPPPVVFYALGTQQEQPSPPSPSATLLPSAPLQQHRACTLCKLSCKIILWSRRCSRVPKRSVNFLGWRWRAINNP